jgi:hypothetical protein
MQKLVDPVDLCISLFAWQYALQIIGVHAFCVDPSSGCTGMYYSFFNFIGKLLQCECSSTIAQQEIQQ